MQGEKLVCASSPVNHTGLHIRARAERRTDQQPSAIIKGRQGNTCTAGGCSSIPATTDPTPSVSCQDQSRWLSSRQHTGHSRLNYHLFTKFTTGPSEAPPLYQVQNWSLRSTTSLPSSELVHQNHHLFTKFRTGPSEPPPLYQIQNWSIRTTNYLPNSELVHQNHQLFTKFRIVHQNHHLFTKFRIGPSRLPSIYQIQNWSLRTTTSLPNSQLVPQNYLVVYQIQNSASARSAAWQQSTCCARHACYPTTSGISPGRQHWCLSTVCRSCSSGQPLCRSRKLKVLCERSKRRRKWTHSQQQHSW